MDKVKKFIKEHTLLFAFIIFCLIMIIVVIKVLLMIFSGNDGDKYGDRLNDIEKYAIDEKVSSKLESELSDLENVDSVTYRLSGKIINIIKRALSSVTLKKL